MFLLPTCFKFFVQFCTGRRNIFINRNNSLNHKIIIIHEKYTPINEADLMKNADIFNFSYQTTIKVLFIHKVHL